VIKYNKAMAIKDKAHWEKAVDAKSQKFALCIVIKPEKIEHVLPNAKILLSTWDKKTSSIL